MNGQLHFQQMGLRLDLGGVRLVQGRGLFRLQLPFTARASSLGDDAVEAVLITGDVALAGLPNAAVGSITTMTLSVAREERSDELCLDLSTERLIALDAARDGGDLRLRLNVTATRLAAGPDEYPMATTQSEFTIRAVEWSEQLQLSGIEVSVAIHVPVPLGAGTAPVEPSWRHTAGLLRQARASFQDGAYQDAVGTCRRTLESMSALVDFPALESLGPSRERSDDERWAVVQHAVTSLVHPALHEDANARTFSWTRSEAEAILAIVAGLVSRTMNRHT